MAVVKMDWEQDVRSATRLLCGRTFVHYTQGGKNYQGIIREICGYEPKEGPREDLFSEPPGTIVLWSYRGGKITNIAAHEYDDKGLVEIRGVLVGEEEVGPLSFTKDFKLAKMDGTRVRRTPGTGIYIVETPGLEEQRLKPVDVLNKVDHPPHRVAHWKLEKS